MGLLTPLAIRIGALPWMPRLLPQIVWTDRTLQRVTRGHVSVLDVGDRTEASLHLKLPGSMTLAEAHDVAESVEREILGSVPELDAVQTHLEPLSEPAAVSSIPDGALRRLNAITKQLESVAFVKAPGYLISDLKREQLAALNSTLLHELYFASLALAIRSMPSTAPS